MNAEQNKRNMIDLILKGISSPGDTFDHFFSLLPHHNGVLEICDFEKSKQCR